MEINTPVFPFVGEGEVKPGTLKHLIHLVCDVTRLVVNQKFDYSIWIE